MRRLSDGGRTWKSRWGAHLNTANGWSAYPDASEVVKFFAGAAPQRMVWRRDRPSRGERHIPDDARLLDLLDNVHTTTWRTRRLWSATLQRSTVSTGDPRDALASACPLPANAENSLHDRNGRKAAPLLLGTWLVTTKTGTYLLRSRRRARAEAGPFLNQAPPLSRLKWLLRAQS